MYLTARNVAPLRKYSQTFRFNGPSPLFRNLAILQLELGGFDIKIDVYRTRNGSYAVRSRLSSTFQGNEEDLRKFLVNGRKIDTLTRQAKRDVRALLRHEERQCARLSRKQLTKCQELLEGFEWFSPCPIEDKDFGPLGFSASDGQGFEWVFKNPEKSGRLEVDTMPDQEVRLWYSHEYLSPLVRNLKTYLKSQGFKVSTKFDAL
jgi:hypothetical protein